MRVIKWRNKILIWLAVLIFLISDIILREKFPGSFIKQVFLKFEQPQLILRRVREFEGAYVIYPEYKIYYRGKRTKFLDHLPDINEDKEQYFNARLNGQVIAVRFEQYISTHFSENKEALSTYLKDISSALDELKIILEKLPGEKTSEELEKIDSLILEINGFITSQAQNIGDPSRDFLKEIGREFGRALGLYLVSISDILENCGIRKTDINELTQNIVLVGGVAENLGKDIVDESGKDLLLREIQKGVKDSLELIGGGRVLAGEIRRSTYPQGYEREFLAFIPEEDNKVSIAISVGGTKIAAGIVNSNYDVINVGKVVWRKELKKEPITEAEKEEAKNNIERIIINLITEAFEKVPLGKEIAKIGISWAGPGEYRKGWIKGPLIWGFEDSPVNLIEELRTMLPENLRGKEIVIEHDGAAAAKGEVSSKGTFQGEGNVLVVIWGTGIGAGILINGEGYYRKPNYNLEIPLNEIGWHIIFMP